MCHQVKMFALEQAMQAQRGVEVYLYSFFNLGSRWELVANATSRPLYPQEGDPVPQGRSGRMRKISPLPGFDPRTVQPVASRYTDYAIPAHTTNFNTQKLCVLPALSISLLCMAFRTNSDHFPTQH